jgi:UDP-N-acetylmuramate dehydrogenase
MPEAYTLIEHAALAPLNTLGVAATARRLAEVRDPALIPTVLALPAAGAR